MLTPKDRPWHASIELTKFRLRDQDSEQDENSLYNSCWRQAARPAARQFGERAFLGSGWEFSVFEEAESVVKIPSGRFEEVDSDEYFANARQNYQVLKQYLGDEYIAPTTFEARSMRQMKIQPTAIADARACHMKIICQRLIKLLADWLWIPDVDPQDSNFMSRPKNFLITDDGVPKLIDFTAYYDVFRLSRNRLAREVKEKSGHLFRHLTSLTIL
jgi:hypothetical protein